MGVKMRPKLTYANVMATIAVFLALGGASYAALKLPKNSVGTKQIKKNAVTTAKIKDGAVTGPKLNLSTLGTVPNASTATNASNATNAANAQPVAFAHVSAKGVLDSANSKNVGAVAVAAEPATKNTYCFSGLPFTPRGGQATVDFNDSGEQFAQFALGTVGGCPANTQAFVFTAPTTIPAGVFVVFYG
jgi:hypothetical protein